MPIGNLEIFGHCNVLRVHGNHLTTVEIVQLKAKENTY